MRKSSPSQTKIPENSLAMPGPAPTPAESQLSPGESPPVTANSAEKLPAAADAKEVGVSAEKASGLSGIVVDKAEVVKHCLNCSPACTCGAAWK